MVHQPLDLAHAARCIPALVGIYQRHARGRDGYRGGAGGGSRVRSHPLGRQVRPLLLFCRTR
jgi:hypothetical protein